MKALRTLCLTLLVLLVSGLGSLAGQERSSADDEVAKLRAKLDRRLAAIQSLAGPGLTFGAAPARKSDSLIGVWSASQEACRQEKVIFFDFQARKSVEWWRSVEAVGLMPWRSGQWEIEDGRVLLTFQREARWLPESGTFEEETFEDRMQLVLTEATGEQLILATPEDDASDFLLLGAPEKLFVRCLL